MSELARQKLREIIAAHARPPALDARRCEGLLRDLCGERERREINVLVAALKERIVDDLLDSGSSLPSEVLLSRCARKLHDQSGIAEDLARWSIESWALALGIVTTDTRTTAASGSKTVSSAGSGWYYSPDGRTRTGPLTSSALKQLASAGQLLPEYFVWKEGAAQWVRADTVKGLFPAAATVPSGAPPLPASLPVQVRVFITGEGFFGNKHEYKVLLDGRFLGESTAKKGFDLTADTLTGAHQLEVIAWGVAGFLPQPGEMDRKAFVLNCARPGKYEIRFNYIWTTGFLQKGNMQASTVDILREP